MAKVTMLTMAGAEAGALDVISLGIDQDAQENFFHPERQNPRRTGAGGVPVRSADGRELARGLTNYSSAEARLIARKASTDFERVLGYAAEPELIHRDNLVLA